MYDADAGRLERLTGAHCGIAGSRVEVIDDSGHAMAADQPERTWAAVSEFLAG